MNSDKDKERKCLSNLKRHCQESRKLLQNHGWIEGKVVKAFLRGFSIKFRDDEIIGIPEGEQPPDIRLRDANFEVTECMEDTRKRGDEYKKKINKIDKANAIIDLVEASQSSILIDFSELLKQIENGMSNKYSKYNNPKTCESLDLLVYVNLNKRHLDPRCERGCHPEFLSKVNGQGWRSISFLTNRCMGVLFCRANAPDFLKDCQRRDVRWPQGSVFDD